VAPKTSAPSILPRLAAAAIGGALVGFGGKREGKPLAALLRAAGLTIIGLAAQPIVEDEIRRFGLERRSVSYRSSVEIGRPVHDVFAFFKDFENLPRVIGTLKSVVDHQDGRSHWVVYGPTRRDTLEWDAVVTKYVPNSVIAWESVRGSVVESSSLLRFTPRSPTATRLDVSITYRPTESGLGEAMHVLFAPRATAQLDADLEHMRYYLESLPAQASAIEDDTGTVEGHG